MGKSKGLELQRPFSFQLTSAERLVATDSQVKTRLLARAFGIDGDTQEKKGLWIDTSAAVSGNGKRKFELPPQYALRRSR